MNVLVFVKKRFCHFSADVKYWRAAGRFVEHGAVSLLLFA